MKSLLSNINMKLRQLFSLNPHRVKKTLKVMRDVLGKHRRISIAREMTKMHETILRGTMKR